MPVVLPRELGLGFWLSEEPEPGRFAGLSCLTMLHRQMLGALSVRAPKRWKSPWRTAGVSRRRCPLTIAGGNSDASGAALHLRLCLSRKKRPEDRSGGRSERRARSAQARGDIMSSKYFKLLVACAALIGLVAFVFFVDFSDEADSSAYGPNAGAPVVHSSASRQ